MPTLTLAYRTEALRCLMLGGRVVGSSETAPPTADRKWLKTDENGARGAGGRKARFCPVEG